MVAAPTTSLPESPGGTRNWDYRYAWVRDATLLLWGLYTLGFDEEANDFFYFIREVVEAHDDAAGDVRHRRRARAARADARPPDRLRGLAAGAGRQRRLPPAPARRLGRAAGLDLPAHEVARRAGGVDLAHRRAARSTRRSRTGASPTAGSGRCAASRATSRPRRSCAGWRATAARGSRACATTTTRAERWQSAADEIHADVCANGVDERGVFTQHYDTTALDASCLLMPLVRFLPPDDERIVRTVHAIADELTEDGLVLRYRTEETDDGLLGEEGAFVICSFWLVSALVELGEIARARGAVREAALLRLRAAALRGGDRHALGPAARQLPAGVQPPGADQRASCT